MKSFFLLCLLPQVVFSQPSVSNDPSCPEEPPTIAGGDPCDFSEALSDCKYNEFTWPNQTESTYEYRCTCFDENGGTFFCAEQGTIPAGAGADPNNIAACPATQPEISSLCTDLTANDECIYSVGFDILTCICLREGLDEDNRSFQCSVPFDPPPVVERQIVVPCFAGDSLVQVQDRGLIPMKHLEIGDQVHVGKNQYETIYSFGHYDQKARASFLEVQTTESTLVVSADHMVFEKSQGFVPSSNLKQGDKLVDGGSGEELSIKSIRNVKAQGVFAPFTPSGTIVVNNVLASSFVSLDSQPKMSIAGISFSHHWMAHTFEFPHRMVCHYLGRCPNESYTKDGISTWVAGPFQVSQWLLRQHAVIRNSLCAVFCTILFMFSFLEACMNNPVLVMGAVAAVGAFLRRSHQKAI